MRNNFIDEDRNILLSLACLNPTDTTPTRIKAYLFVIEYQFYDLWLGSIRGIETSQVTCVAPQHPQFIQQEKEYGINNYR